METKVQLEERHLISKSAEEKLASFGVAKEYIQHISETTKSLDFMYVSGLDRVKAASKNPAYLLEDGGVILPFWQDPNMRPDGGSCYDAAENLRFTWFFDGTMDALHDRDLRLFVCAGSDGKFFVGEGFNHVFLAIAKLDRDGQNFKYENTVVIDPSLQNISVQSESSYAIKHVFPEEYVFANDLNKKIIPYDISGLDGKSFFINNRSTAVIGMDPQREYVFYTIILHDKQTGEYYPAMAATNGRQSEILYKTKGSTTLTSRGSLVLNTQTENLVRSMANELSKIKVVPANYRNGFPVDQTGARLTDMPLTKKFG